MHKWPLEGLKEIGAYIIAVEFFFELRMSNDFIMTSETRHRSIIRW